MVQFVAEAAGSQAGSLSLKPVAAAVLGLDFHIVRPGHVAPLAGNGQAALQIKLLAGGLDNLGC